VRLKEASVHGVQVALFGQQVALTGEHDKKGKFGLQAQ